MFFLRLIKNKYLISILALFVWLLFFDKNDVFSQYELVQKCKKLEQDTTYYYEQIKLNRQYLNALRKDPKYLETVAREKYLMKKEDEDVFVFVTN